MERYNLTTYTDRLSGGRHSLEMMITEDDGKWVKWEDAEPYIKIVKAIVKHGNPEWTHCPTWLAKVIYESRELIGGDSDGVS